MKVVVWPGSEMVMTPAQLQVQIETLSSAGRLAIMTVGEPGVQGEAVAGMQGCGVSTPAAAAVAAATCGLARLEHMPNGIMLTIGMWSSILAGGWFSTKVRLVGNTTRIDGAAPKLHTSCAPLTVCIGIVIPGRRMGGAKA